MKRAGKGNLNIKEVTENKEVAGIKNLSNHLQIQTDKIIFVFYPIFFPGPSWPLSWKICLVSGIY